jgi:non-ribosomal peptide synthetase component F
MTAILDAAAKEAQAKPVGQIPLSDFDQPSSSLPDPTSDLHWSEWRGAITDIFAANSEKHPERTCIVESSEQGGEVVYTYQHIHYASNLVAHYLIHKGIQPEDVVMIYAYRGVDLVVAIMGVLKAGATFSVIGKSINTLELVPFAERHTNNLCFVMIHSTGRSCLSSFSTADLPLCGYPKRSDLYLTSWSY